MKLYLAGPMSGYRNFNFWLFHRVAKSLREQGHDVVNPADKETIPGTWLYDATKQIPRTQVMREDLSLLLTCEAIALLPEWERSKGATLEREVAQQCGFTVFEVFMNGKGVALLQERPYKVLQGIETETTGEQWSKQDEKMIQASSDSI